jgi:uncharacterized SAM-binding protein YcdF (DUF218 family)
MHPLKVLAMSKRRMRIFLTAAAILFICIGCHAARGVILPALGTWLDVGERPRPADFLMVLTGDENSRPFAAAALMHAGYARKTLIAEAETSAAAKDGIIPPADQIIRRVMVSRGVASEDVITLSGSAANTFDEAQALAAFLKNHPDARILIVTTHCHTRRARWIFSRVIGNLQNITFTSVPTDGFQLSSWWRNEKGFRAVASEYGKLFFYIIRYGYTTYLPVGATILLILVIIYRHGFFRRRAGNCSSIATTSKTSSAEIPCQQNLKRPS